MRARGRHGGGAGRRRAGLVKLAFGAEGGAYGGALGQYVRDSQWLDDCQVTHGSLHTNSSPDLTLALASPPNVGRGVSSTAVSYLRRPFVVSTRCVPMAACTVSSSRAQIQLQYMLRSQNHVVPNLQCAQSSERGVVSVLRSHRPAFHRSPQCASPQRRGQRRRRARSRLLCSPTRKWRVEERGRLLRDSGRCRYMEAWE